MEKTKASLAQELVTLANNVEELEKSNKSLISIKNNYDVSVIGDLYSFLYEEFYKDTGGWNFSKNKVNLRTNWG